MTTPWIALATAAVLSATALAVRLPAADAAPPAPLPEQAAGAPAGPEPAVAALERFTARFWRRLATERAGNLCIAPYSIHSVLSMTMRGAAGDTLAEMRAILGEGGEGFHAAQAALREALVPGAVLVRADGEPQEVPAHTLGIANRIVAHDGYRWHADFVDACRRRYGVGVGLVDLVADVEGAREQINGWVAERTADRIAELLPVGSIGNLTRMILINGVSFRADWQHPFPSAATAPGDFAAQDGDRRVLFMRRSMRVPVALEVLPGGGSLLVLPYAGGEVECLLLHGVEPDAVDPVAAIAAHRPSVQPRQVRVELPRFALPMDGSIPLGATLAGLGMERAFDGDRADFSRMSPDALSHGLHVEEVYHQTFLALDERGTEAAGATAAVMGLRGAPPPDEATLRFDRPFLIAIRHVRIGAILFLARVAEPESER